MSDGARSPAAKRLMREAAELATPSEDYHAQPLGDDLFEWHFTVRGPRATDFAGGVYHGRILLPEQYPMRPPHIVLLTPNGRFETHRKICLSISGHHPETWQPSWSIRTALLALAAFMPAPAEGTVGSLDCEPAERRALARRSVAWRCAECGAPEALLSRSEEGDPAPSTATAPPAPTSEASDRSCVVSAPPTSRRRGSPDALRDCVFACLLVALSIFVFRRLDFFLAQL